MAHNLPINGPDLANYLALNLSDLEFELLIRNRIRHRFEVANARNPNLSESHNYCHFSYNAADKSTWNIAIGETYSKKADTTGEVLTATFADCEQIMDQKSRNKLSLLLPAPTTAEVE